MMPPTASSRHVADADPRLQAAQAEIKRRWEAHFPDWVLKPTTVYRSPEDQMKAFKSKHSNIDGVTKRGNHNFYPSRAIDNGIFRKRDGMWIDTLYQNKAVTQDQYRAMYAVYGLIAQSLGLRWGNDWDGDGIPVAPDPDESLVDAYHIELLP